MDAEIGEGRTESVEVGGGLLKQDSWNGMVETDSRVELRLPGQQFLDYWLWRCRTNPADEEPKPTIAYNRDPKVADYKDGEEVLKIMMEACHG